MRTKRFHGLKRPKIRMTMNKYNFYNLARMKTDSMRNKTYFQQKWKSKAATRAYHGEVIKEKKWERMFQSRIRSVVPMNARYLAAWDGSEQAAGRGSGATESAEQMRNRMKIAHKPTPYMAMTYAPSERRLDTAIFRALFASSARQARQFVIHGSVKVNGKKMIHPGYLLNPGDMFEVEPERVLYALGAGKDAADREATRSALKRKTKAAPTEIESEGFSESSEAAAPEPAAESTEVDPADAEKAEKKKRKQHKDNLQALLADAKAIIEDGDASAKKKQRIRAFAATVRRSMGNARKTSVENLDAEIEELVAKLSLAEAKNAPAEPAAAPAPTSNDPALNAQIASNMKENIQKETRPEDKQLLIKALREIRENPIDPSKPYATPWRPRPFLPAFAFVPRYLEVNHNICSAVYLRHPVARPGLAEVPTPFPLQTMGLSYNWYLRRGR